MTHTIVEMNRLYDSKDTENVRNGKYRPLSDP